MHQFRISWKLSAHLLLGFLFVFSLTGCAHFHGNWALQHYKKGEYSEALAKAELGVQQG